MCFRATDICRLRHGKQEHRTEKWGVGSGEWGKGNGGLIPTPHLSVRSFRVTHIADCSKTAPDEVGHFDEECAAVAAEAGFELVGEGVVSVARQIVVVADVERRARIRRPSEQELPANVRSQSGVINSRPREEEPGELIGRSRRIDVVVEGYAPGVVSPQTALR